MEEIPKLDPIGIFAVNNEEFLVELKDDGENGLKYFCFNKNNKAIELNVLCKIDISGIARFLKKHLEK